MLKKTSAVFQNLPAASGILQRSMSNAEEFGNEMRRSEEGCVTKPAKAPVFQRRTENHGKATVLPKPDFHAIPFCIEPLLRVKNHRNSAVLQNLHEV